MSEHDVILIGSGMGGMTTAALVASVACLFASFVDLIPFPPRCLFYRST
jgi:succinate dehydrogenase/fumarate reductase flavoprotein subunit